MSAVETQTDATRGQHSSTSHRRNAYASSGRRAIGKQRAALPGQCIIERPHLLLLLLLLMQTSPAAVNADKIHDDQKTSQFIHIICIGSVFQSSLQSYCREAYVLGEQELLIVALY